MSFPRRYGDGSGDVKPLGLLKLKSRSDDIAKTLENPKNLDASTVKGLEQEKRYIDKISAMRFTRLAPTMQARVKELTRDPTFGKKPQQSATQPLAGLRRDWSTQENLPLDNLTA